MYSLEALRGQIPKELFDVLNALVDQRTNASVLQPNLGIVAGVVPSARLIFSAQPADTNTITIGGKVITFLNALVAAGATTQVKIGASAADTLASLVKAINGTPAAPAEWVESTSPFNVAVKADAVGTSLRIQAANVRGGTPQAMAGPNVALAETIADAADVWNCANLNVSGKPDTQRKMAVVNLVLTAAMLTTAGYNVQLPFTPTAVTWFPTDATGAFKTTTDTVTVVPEGSVGSVLFAQAGVTHLAATDIVHIVAIE